MLRVSGKEVDGRKMREKHAPGDVDAMVEVFERGLQDLDDVIWEEGNKGQGDPISDPHVQRPGSGMVE